MEYLNALQQHAQDVITHAARWLPWNYREQLADLTMRPREPSRPDP
jgi:hypothetical protein